jgi:hypothetical protein
MKFIDTFTEDDKKKLIKKAKLIFSVLKKGTITRSDGVSFSYILGDNMKPIVVNGEIEIFAFIFKIIEKTYCPLGINAIKELIIKKFKHFDIEVELYQTPSTEIEKYQGKKPWEKEEVNEERLTPEQETKEKKRALTIFKGLRKGVVKIPHPRTDEIIKFRYHINNNIDGRWQVFPERNYWGLFTSNEEGEGMTVHIDNEKVFDLCTQGTESITTNPTGIHLIQMLILSIQKKFDTFEVKIHINKPGIKFVLNEPKDELNEEIDIDKERKRVKTIHKAIRKGVVNLSDGKYRYELPENYKFYLMDNEMINIKFTFNNHDLGQNFAGVGLPLRVWRIEDGKDVFLNGILSKDDVSDIVYGDDYLLNTKSGVDYTNVKNKIRNKYRDFNINAIMTSPSDNPMDLTPMVNESEEDYIKKAKTIFKAFRKGTIGSKDDPSEARFKYELSDDISISRNNVGIIIFTSKVNIIELNRACRHTSVGYMADKIRNRFRDFGIILEHPHIDKEDVDTDLEREGELNEGAEVLNPESLTDKEIKKVKLVYKSFKKGHFVYDQLSTYGYELPDDYYIYKDELGDVCVKLDKKDTDKFYMYAKVLSHEMELLPHHDGLHRWVKERVIKKFDGFNIKFIF